MLGRSALARYDPVLTVVLNPHHRVLAQLPRLGAHRGKDDHRFALHRVSLGTAGALVEFDLITGPSGWARLVVPGKRHVGTVPISSLTLLTLRLLSVTECSPGRL